MTLDYPLASLRYSIIKRGWDFYTVKFVCEDKETDRKYKYIISVSREVSLRDASDTVYTMFRRERVTNKWVT